MPVPANGEVSIEDRLKKMETDLSKQKPTIDPQVANQLKEAGKAEVMKEILADPTLVGYLDAKRNGKKMKLVEDNPAPQEQVDFAKLQEDGDPNKLVDAIGKDLLGKTSKQIEDHLNPIKQQLSQMNTFFQAQAKDKVLQTIDSARKEFSDFDEHLEDMKSLSERNPNLSPRDLYVLAVTSKGKPIKTERRTETESPTGDVVRPPRKPLENITPGSRGIGELVQHSMKTSPTIQGILAKLKG